jgi:hypothetical protein
MKIIVNDLQFYLLETFISTNQSEYVIEKLMRPLEKLKKCQFTNDGKYVVYEGKAYNTENGNEIPINEGWTLSDILHTGADILSIGLDFVIPGSGAVVDTLNAISYIIEAQYKTDEKEKDSLYIMAAITFGFVLLPGALQAISTPLKKAVTTGKGLSSPIVVKGLKIIGGVLDNMLFKLPSKISEALKSPLAKNILGKWGNKISDFFKKFAERIKTLLGKIGGKTGKESAELTGKLIANADNTIMKFLPAKIGKVSNELIPVIASKTSSLSKIPNVLIGKDGVKILDKFGFEINKSYTFGKKIFKIKKPPVGEYIDFVEITGGKEISKKIKLWDFLKKFILEPSAKLNTTTIPLITKSIVRVFNSNGQLNSQELDTMEKISSDQTQQDLSQLSSLVADYEGDTGKYTVNNNVKTIQQSLIKLGYPLPKFKDDGKFGPETISALKKFQEDNGLTSSIGKMDRLTARKLAELLKSKNVAGSEDLQSSLNKI